MNRDSAEIFKFPSVLIIAQHSLDSFCPAWKNEPCSEGLVQIGHDSAFISFDHSIALLGLISTGSQKWVLFWRFGADRSKSTEIFKFLLKFNQNCPSRAHPSHLDGKIGHCGSFWAASCEVIWKSLKTRKIANVPPQEQKFLRFLQKWDTLVVKRWEKLWIRWNWPFQVNLSLILGEKMEKPAKWPKLAILSQSKPLFWQNLPLWVILSHFSVKWFEKVEKLKKIASAYQSRFCWDI